MRRGVGPATEPGDGWQAPAREIEPEHITGCVSNSEYEAGGAFAKGRRRFI